MFERAVFQKNEVATRSLACFFPYMSLSSLNKDSFSFMKRAHLFIKLFLGLGILVLLFVKLPSSEISAIFSSISLRWYFLGILFLLIFCLVKCLRWMVLVHGMGMKFSYGKLFSIYFKGILLGVVTPGRLGEFGRAFFMKEKDNCVFKSFASILIDRFLDIGILFPFIIIGLVIYSDILDENVSKLLIWCLLFVLFTTVMLFLVCKCAKIKRKVLLILTKIIPSKIYDNIKLCLNGIISLQPKVLFLAIVLSLILQVLWGVIGYSLLASLGESTSFFWLLWCMCMVAIISNLPVSFLGIGIRESAFTFFFVANNFSGSLGLSFGLLISSLWFWMGILGLMAWGADSRVTRVKTLE